MKKTRLILACLLLVVGILYLSACGGKTEKQAKSVTVKPKTTAVKGDLGDYFEVVERDYQIKTDPKSFMSYAVISVEVKRTDKDFTFPTDKINPFGTNGSEDYHVGFGIEIFGENEPEVIKNANAGGMSGPYSADDVTGLMKLKKGETGFIRWSVEEDKLDKLKTFQLSSALEKSTRTANNGNNANSSQEKSEAVESDNSGGANWDSALDGYEEYTDKYIELLKKSKNGDASALMEYASFLQKAQDAQTKLSKAGNDLSTTQMARFTQIQTKLLKSAQEIIK